MSGASLLKSGQAGHISDGLWIRMMFREWCTPLSCCVWWEMFVVELFEIHFANICMMFAIVCHHVFLIIVNLQFTLSCNAVWEVCDKSRLASGRSCLGQPHWHNIIPGTAEPTTMYVGGPLQGPLFRTHCYNSSTVSGMVPCLLCKSHTSARYVGQYLHLGWVSTAGTMCILSPHC